MDVLEAAEAWGIPPWELEATAPDIWMERRLLWASAKVRRANYNAPPRGQTVQVGNKRKTRVI